MTQTFTLPTLATIANQALATMIPATLETLRSQFSGSSAPSSPAPVPGQPWVDTSEEFLKIRNIADTDWVRFGRLVDEARALPSGSWNDLTLSATKTAQIAIAPRASKVLRVAIVASNASSSSSGNEWEVQLKRYPAATPGTPEDLFSGTVGTFTSLGGVGGGAELVADAAWFLTPDQNATLTAGDKLELIMTKVGTATTLNNFHAQVEVE